MLFRSGAIIDYLQILSITNKTQTEEQFLGSVARRLKNLAKELNIWIIALSQLNRKNAENAPSLSDIRASGQIGEAADNVVFIYRPEVFNRSYPAPFASTSTQGTAMIDIAKGRSVGLKKFILGFKPEQTLFYNINDIQENVPF